MVSFYVYDIIFLVLFCLFVILFIKSKGKKVDREGIIFMYRTQVGVKAITWFSNKFRKILHPLKYAIIGTGFVLMGAMIWMLWTAVSTYIFVPEVTKVIKAPPIAPLIPYFPEIFGLRSFFPSFYFTYFIIAIAIVMIVHEFSHGIYMKLFKIKIKSTGIIFLGPLLGAFVEEEKKQFEKKKNIEQMSVLGAGVFANVITALIFVVLLLGIYNYGFTQSGYVFNTYAYTEINFSDIEYSGETINLNVLYLGQQMVLNLTEVRTGNNTYLVYTQGLISLQKENNNRTIIAFYDAPAIRGELMGGIIEVDGIKIKNQEDLRKILESKSQGDSILITTEIRGKKMQKEITLAEHPFNSSIAFLGISYIQFNNKDTSLLGRMIGRNYIKFREPNMRGDTYYSPLFNSNFIIFVYDLLWWVILINFLVALFNMLPLGILDGGKFFYLTLLSVTRSEKFAKGAYKFATWLILFAFILMMVFYIFRMII